DSKRSASGWSERRTGIMRASVTARGLPRQPTNRRWPPSDSSVPASRRVALRGGCQEPEIGIVAGHVCEQRVPVEQQVAVQAPCLSRSGYLAHPNVETVVLLSMKAQLLKLPLNPGPFGDFALLGEAGDFWMFLCVALEHAGTDQERCAGNGVNESLRIVDDETMGLNAFAQPGDELKPDWFIGRSGRRMLRSCLDRRRQGARHVKGVR